VVEAPVTTRKINSLEDVSCVLDAMELKAGSELCHFAQDSLAPAGSLGPQSVGGDREMSAADAE
jgi:hypothetical protein